MSNYNLLADEVVLYKGIAKRQSSENGQVEVLLTNLNIVLIDTIDDVTSVETLPIATLKIYKGIPQVKHKGLNVEMYFTSGEQYLTFANRVEIHKLVKAIYELVTGKTQFERGALKVKKGIETTNDTLGIDTVETVRNAVLIGLGASIEMSNLNNETSDNVQENNETSDKGQDKKEKRTKVVGNSKWSNVLKVAQGVVESTKGLIARKEEKPLRIEGQKEMDLEALKTLKEFLDVGIISQEEYEIKKKEILGL